MFRNRPTLPVSAFCLIVLKATLLASCGTKNVLTYHHRKYYKERSEMHVRDRLVLTQDIGYNTPAVNDEEFTYYLFPDICRHCSSIQTAGY